MDLKKFIRSFGYALQGILTLLKTEQNARVHFTVGITVGALAYLFGVNHLEAAVLFFAVALVFIVEITNTAIEKLLDLVHPENHRQVAFIKDAMAGATFIAAIIAAVVGFLTFWPYLARLKPSSLPSPLPQVESTAIGFSHQKQESLLGDRTANTLFTTRGQYANDRRLNASQPAGSRIQYM